jgi:hypothetical protein
VIDQQFDRIEKADLDRLVANGVPEGRSLEYKELLPGGNDGERREFLADISSLANTIGGDVVYGVREGRDENGKATDMPSSVEGVAVTNRDTEVQRLESMLRDGIGPRLSGMRYRWVDGFGLGPALVVRVPESWSRPHMVTFQQLSRFYARAANGKYLMDVGQLRDTFLYAGNIAARAAAIRIDRYAQIIAGETPVPLSGQILIIAHAIPYASIGNDALVEMRTIAQHAELFPPFYSESQWGRFNVDGYVTQLQVGRETRTPGYAQLFRTGILETVDSEMISEREPGRGVWLPSTTFARSLFDFIARTKRLYQVLDVPPPVSIDIIFKGVKTCTLAISDHWGFHHHQTARPFHRDVVRLPQMVLEEFDAELQPEVLARPLLDALWQGAGLQRCLDYNESGAWKPR